MTREETDELKDAKECLAGFMLSAAINGAHLDSEMEEWAMNRLKGKPRTPSQVFQSILAAEKSPADPPA